jgi:hypothetical protein
MSDLPVGDTPSAFDNCEGREFARRRHKSAGADVAKSAGAYVGKSSGADVAKSAGADVAKSVGADVPDTIAGVHFGNSFCQVTTTINFPDRNCATAHYETETEHHAVVNDVLHSKVRLCDDRTQLGQISMPLKNVYHTPEVRRVPLYRRGFSMSAVGPKEFLEMYRSRRSFSDTTSHAAYCKRAAERHRQRVFRNSLSVIYQC